MMLRLLSAENEGIKIQNEEPFRVICDGFIQTQAASFFYTKAGKYHKTVTLKSLQQFY